MTSNSPSGLEHDQQTRPTWGPVVIVVVVVAALVIALAVVQSTSASDPAVDVAATSEPSPSPTPDDTDDAAEPVGDTVVAKGKFENEDYDVEGAATVVETPDGGGVLQLGKDFSSESGPALVVYLLPEGVDVTKVKDGSALGALQSFTGAQNYTLPRSFNASDAAGATVVIWCQKFSVPFGSAALT